MKVWRVAHSTLAKEGFHTGPYTNRSKFPDGTREAIREMYLEHCDARHPDPALDSGLGHIDPWEFCGFSSEAALYNWFAGWSKVLSAAGFLIRTYEVPEADVRCGKFGQVLFRHYAATELEAYALSLDPVQLEIPGVNL